MKTEVTPERLKEFVDELEHKKIKYFIIAGWGLDGKRGYQTRPHQDADILVLEKDKSEVEKVIEKLNYSRKQFGNVNKLKREDGSKIDLTFMTIEGDEAVTYGGIAETRFPKKLIDKTQKGHLQGIEFNVGANELLKTWGQHAGNEEDRKYAATLPADEGLMKRIKRILKSPEDMQKHFQQTKNL